MSEGLGLRKVARLELLEQEGHSLPKEFPRRVDLAEKEIRFGRATNNHVILNSVKYPRMISRNHAVLRKKGDNQWQIVDLGSTNGLFVNNVKVEEAVLKPDDVIVFGGGGGVPLGTVLFQHDSEFKYRFVEEPCHRLRAGVKRFREKVVEGGRKRPKLLLDVEKKKLEENLRTLRSLHAEETLLYKSKIEQLQRVIEELQKKSSTENLSSISNETASNGSETELKQESKCSTSFQPSDFEEEFTCSICQELFVQAATLQCSHSFCHHCISRWLKQKQECPVCRLCITKRPVFSRNLDNIVRKIASCLPLEERSRHEDRIQRIQKEQQEKAAEDLCKLQALIAEAKAGGANFMRITDVWTLAEKNDFHHGVSIYSGEARRVYCETTGLTKDFVEQATLAQLRQTCKNLNLPQTVLKLSSVEIQRKILDFIDRG